MSCFRLMLAVAVLTVWAIAPVRAQLVINELSNGASGAQEYVELLVVGTPSCTNTCVDLRGWVLDDNNGTFATGTGTGIAAGHMRFANNATWQCVPIGTLIVVYNNADRNPSIPADNLTGANCRYIIPANSTLFERNTSEPSVGGVATYGGPYVSGGDWNTQGLSNSEDSYQTRAPGALGVPHHAVSYGGNNSNTIIYFAGAGGGLVYSMTNNTSNDPAVQANWTSASAATNQTPGAPNNTANATWIASMNNNCSPAPGGPQVDLGADVSICAGDSVTIRATVNIPGGTFVWNGSSLGTQDSIRIAPTVATQVIVNYTLSPGCTDADTLNINILAQPNGAITGNTAICIGQSTTLTASGGTSYLWSTAEITPAIAVSPTTATAYSVTVTGANGCRDTVSATVNVNAQPNGAIAGNTTICSSSNTTLTASGGTSYLWSTSEVTAAIVVSPTSNTIYTVTVTDANGCSDTVSTTVNVNARPTGAIAGTTVICSGGSTLLTASGGTSYVWSTAEAMAAITVSPTSNTTYTVTITDGNGCRDTVSATVTVNSSITGSITGNTTICAGQSNTLTASGGSTYLWSNAQTTAAITVNPATTTVYSVTVSSGASCADTVTVTVTVNPNPIANITGDTDICLGEITTLTASGGTSYLWNNGQTTAVITVAPTANTTYQVTVTDANGCIGAAISTVTVNALPTANAGAPQIICEGNSVSLTATGGGTYVWSNGQTTATISVSPANTTDYAVTVTNAAGCTDADTVTVTVNPNSIVLQDSLIVAETCAQGNGQIILASPSNFITYELYENGVRVDSILGGGIFFDLEGGTYTVVATDNNGCSRTLNNVIVPSSAVPQATVAAITPSCFGDADGVLTLGSATPGLYYSLNGGTPQQDSVFTGLAAGDYTIRVIDSLAGCDNIINYTLTQPEVLQARITPDSSNIIFGSVVELTSIVSGGTTGYTYQWVPATTLNCDTCANVNAMPTDSITVYILTVTDTNGCVDTARAVIRATNEFLITVPTGFTPNLDGWNDFLRPLANEPIDFNLMVFNRWGEKIFEGDGLPGWDGKYKYEEQPIGTYVYVIEYTRLLNGQRGYLTGSITLLR